jgi:hypothetical protein
MCAAADQQDDTQLATQIRLGRAKAGWEISMLGFSLDSWDYVTFAALFILGVGALVAIVFVLGLPGRIAIARKHPDAEAVNIMGWVGFLALVPWIQAFIWAFKPTQVVDIRRYPLAEQTAISEEIARMSGKGAADRTSKAA